MMIRNSIGGFLNSGSEILLKLTHLSEFKYDFG